MFRRNAIALAVGGVALFSGCAAPSAGLKVEPVMAVRDGGIEAERMYRIGRQYQGQARHGSAEEAFLKALALDPGHVEARNALGVAYFAQGKIRAAEEQFRMAIVVAPARAHLHNNLGYLYQQIGRSEEAVNAFSEALRLDPRNPRILNNLAALTCQDVGNCTATAAPIALPAADAAASQPAEPAPTVQLASVAPNVWELRPISADSSAGRPQATEPAATATAAQAPLPASRIEVANGNGVTGLAKRVGTYLRDQGYAAPRLTNHRTFSQQRTEIQYVPGAESVARRLNDTLAHPARLVPVAQLERRIPVRIVLGKDFNEAQSIAQGNQPAGNVFARASVPDHN